MNTTIGSMMTQPTTTKDWTWTVYEANSGEMDEELTDRVASLVTDEVGELYNDMRFALNDVFDECYPDPTPENEEEYFDRHAEWVDWFDGEFWDEECGNPGVVRLVKDDDGYTLAARDADGEQGDRRRTTRLDPALSDRDICRRVREFLRGQDPCGDVKSRCAAGMSM